MSELIVEANPKKPQLQNFPLLSTVVCEDGEGVVIARSMDRPMRYDVRLESGKVLTNRTDVKLVKAYDGPPLRRA